MYICCVLGGNIIITIFINYTSAVNIGEHKLRSNYLVAYV